MKVSEVMNLKKFDNLSHCPEFFRHFHSFPLVPVVDEHNILIGVVSFQRIIEAFHTSGQDLLKAVAFVDEHHLDIFDMDITPEIGQLCLVDDLMQTKFVTINQDSSLEEAYQFMQLHKSEQLPVVDSENKLVGMLGAFDILLALFREKGVIK